jgi:cytosine/adenosine deaminase-related metal-dependent hydrolase
MHYRKFQADYLFDGHVLHQDKPVLVTDETGKVLDLLPAGEAGETVECREGLISPGFINCHCHLELSHLKGIIPEGTGLVDFVLSVLSRRKAPEAQILDAIAAAESELLSGGTVAVGDICNGPDTLEQKAAGRMAYYNFIELAGWLPAQAQNRFLAGMKLYQAFAERTGDEAHLALTPHAPYSVSPALWALLRTGFQQKTISIHNQETAAEDEFFISGSGPLTRMYEMMGMDHSHFSAPGRSSLAFFLNELEKAGRIMLVHNTYTRPEDLRRAASFSPDLYFCLCPNANLYIEGRLPDIAAMMQCSVNLVLGTDSLASNRQLSVLEELKTIRRYFPQAGTATLLQWATSNGARALQLEQRLGDFSRGKRPGVVLIEYPGTDPLGPESRSRRLL